MNDLTPLPLDGPDHLVEPPIIDFLFFDSDSDAYVITFVPEASVSRDHKEVVNIARASEDGRRTELRLKQIGVHLGGDVGRVFHAGGGDFGFYFGDGRLYQLSIHAPSSAVTQKVYVCLQDLGTVAQLAFCAEAESAGRSAPRPSVATKGRG